MVEQYLNPLYSFDDLYDLFKDEYIRIYGEKKYNEVIHKMHSSETLEKTILKAQQNRITLSTLDYTEITQSIFYFLFSKPDTLALGSIYFLLCWHNYVNMFHIFNFNKLIENRFISILLKCKENKGSGTIAINRTLDHVEKYESKNEYYWLIILYCTTILYNSPYKNKKYSCFEIAFICISTIERKYGNWLVCDTTIVPEIKEELAKHFNKVKINDNSLSDKDIIRLMNDKFNYYFYLLSDNNVSNLSISGLSKILNYNICIDPLNTRYIKSAENLDDKSYLNYKELEELINKTLMQRVKKQLGIPEDKDYSSNYHDFDEDD